MDRIRRLPPRLKHMHHTGRYQTKSILQILFILSPLVAAAGAGRMAGVAFSGLGSSPATSINASSRRTRNLRTAAKPLRSERVVSAINGQIRTRDKRRVVTQQKEHRRRNFHRMPHSAEDVKLSPDRIKIGRAHV